VEDLTDLIGKKPSRDEIEKEIIDKLLDDIKSVLDDHEKRNSSKEWSDLSQGAYAANADINIHDGNHDTQPDNDKVERYIEQIAKKAGGIAENMTGKKSDFFDNIESVKSIRNFSNRLSSLSKGIDSLDLNNDPQL
jgi:endonuclease IV